MQILEIPEFSKLAKKILSKEEKEKLFVYLTSNPEAGKLIPGAKGLRKLRVSLKNKGKRGGGRVIYYYYKSHSEIYVVTIYEKNDIEDITPKARKAYIKIIEEIIRES